YTYVDTIVYSGFETNPANSANSYKNTDVEKVLGSNPDLSRYLTSAGRWNAEYGTNAIDPCTFYDEAGNLKMVYGSWFGGIYMLDLDENTGLRDYTVTYATVDSGTNKSDAYLGKKIAGGHWASGEGPYIEYMNPAGSNDGYYYLFLSYGYFNNKGGYNMRVFRSKNPEGPYLDQNGNNAFYETSTGDANTAGNTGERLMSNYQWSCNDRPNTAQGHNSALLDDDGKLFVIYHNKFDDDYGFHEVRTHQLIVNEDGWITATAYEYSGETLSKKGHSLDAVVGDYELIWHNPNQKFVNEKSADVEKPINITLNADGTVTGDITATWQMTDGTPYMSFTWGGVTYKGAFIVQNDESDTPVTKMTFTATGINICIWGSKKEAYDITKDLVNRTGSGKMVYQADENAENNTTVKIGDTDLLSGVSYYITNKFNGKSLDLTGAESADGTNIQQWNLTGGSQQEWRIIATENGYCKIVSMTDESKAITVDGSTADNGLNIQIAAYTGADNQQFKLIQNRGFYGIVSKSSADKAGLDVYAWSEENGGNINQWEYWGGDCQLWYITPVYPEINDADYVIKSVNSGLWLSSDANGSAYQNHQEYIWNVKSTGDGYYQILNQDGKALTVQDASAEDGKDVYLADLTGDTSQKFNLYTNNDGSVSILTAVSGSTSSLDVYGISQDAGANICQWNYWGGVGQQWILTPAVAETPEPETESETELITEPVTEEPATEEPTTEEITTESETVLTPSYGDVNEDGSINILDVISLNKAILGKEFLTKQGELNADVNEDSHIDSGDALNIMKYIVQLVTSFPVK
ncbi:MAG: RICIN domain-containing protein, partial [Oscillospiraceae bacterium]|nr:RICIN domain-containing protein [Oscillospiraceae bacterium]